MSHRKISTTIYMTPEQDRLLKALNARTRVPIAEYVREGIDMLLAAAIEHGVFGDVDADGLNDLVGDFPRRPLIDKRLTRLLPPKSNNGGR